MKLKLLRVNDTPKIHLHSLGSVNIIYVRLGECKFHLHMAEKQNFRQIEEIFAKVSLSTEIYARKFILCPIWE